MPQESSFLVDTYIQRSEAAFTLSAKRYRPTRQSHAKDGRRNVSKQIVLLLAHGLSYCKEMWEPVISRLFLLDAQNNERVIAEAWALDGPGHGDSCPRDEKLVVENVDALRVYANMFLDLLYSRRVTALESKVVVFVGECAGSISAILAAEKSLHSFAGLFLIEPPVVSEKTLLTASQLATLRSDTRETWPNTAEALAWHLNRRPFDTWHPDSLHVHMKYALKECDGVIKLKCTTAFHVAGLRNLSGPHEGYVALTDVCPIIPVHLIFGTRFDFQSREVQDSLNDASQGRKMASVTRISGGHLVAHEAPAELAEVLYSRLSKLPARSLSKL